MPTDSLARLLIVGGLVLLGVGLLVLLLGRIPFFGRLPGDITFSRGNVTVYVPLVTMLLLSLLLTLLMNIFFRR
jgi:hypothetical protein